MNFQLKHLQKNNFGIWNVEKNGKYFPKLSSVLIFLSEFIIVYSTSNRLSSSFKILYYFSSQ